MSPLKEDVKTVIKYLIECHRQGDAVYHGEDLIAPQIKSLHDVPAGILTTSDSVYNVFNSYAAQKRRSRKKLDILCRLLLLRLFESHPFPLGKELAYIYGRLKRMKDSGAIESLYEKISESEAESEIDHRSVMEIRGELFGKSLVTFDLCRYTADRLPSVELATERDFCKFLESQFMLALIKLIVSADESLNPEKRDDLNACIELMSGQTLYEFMNRMVGKSPTSFVETLTEELGSCKKPTDELEDQVRVIVAEIRSRFIGDFAIEDFKVGELYLLPSKSDDEAFSAMYAQALVMRFSWSSFHDGLEALQSRLSLISQSTALANCGKKVSIKDFVKSVDALFKTSPGSGNWQGLIAQPHQTPSAVSMFLGLVKKNIELYANGRYYSPYMVVCNSTGSGKTKLAMELASSVVSIFLCLRSADVSGEPPKSIITDYFIKCKDFFDDTDANIKKEHPELDLEKVMQFIFAIMDTWIEIVPQWMAKMSSLKLDYCVKYPEVDDPTDLKVIGDLIAVNADVVPGENYHVKFWSLVQTKSSNLIGELKKAREELKKKQQQQNQPSSSSAVPIQSANQESASNQPYTNTGAQNVTDPQLVGGQESASNQPATNTGAPKVNDPDSAEVDPNPINETHVGQFAERAASIRKVLQDHFKMSKENADSTPIVFVFDEARSMLSPQEMDPKNRPTREKSLFRILRRAIRCFQCKAFVILMDTLSRITNFALTDRDDHSRRNSRMIKLFDPLLLFPLVNTVKIKEHTSELESALAHSSEYCNLHYRLLEEVEVGRGLFTTHWNLLAPSKSSRDKWKTVYQSASDKFAFSTRQQSYSTDTDEDAVDLYLAVLAAKFGVHYASNIVNTYLMNSRMAFGLGITPDRDFLSAGYLGEPLVSEVVSRRLYLTGTSSLDICLNTLRDKLLSGSCVVSDIGSTGELVMAIYLSLARDYVVLEPQSRKLKDNLRFCDPCNVHSFLSNLCSNQETIRQLNQEHPLLMNSFVSFSSFMYMLPKHARRALLEDLARVKGREASAGADNKLPIVNKKLLMEGWKRRVAYYLPPGTEGIDIIIPVVVGRRVPETHEASSHPSQSMAMEMEEDDVTSGKSKVQTLMESSATENPQAAEARPLPHNGFEPTEDDMSAIVVQVKNLADRIYKKDVIEIVQKMYSPGWDKVYEEGFRPIFGIVCNVGRGDFAENLTGTIMDVALSPAKSPRAKSQKQTESVESAESTTAATNTEAPQEADMVCALVLDRSLVQESLGISGPIRNVLNLITTVGDSPHEALRKTYVLDRDDNQSTAQVLSMMTFLYSDASSMGIDGGALTASPSHMAVDRPSQPPSPESKRSRYDEADTASTSRPRPTLSQAEELVESMTLD